METNDTTEQKNAGQKYALLAQKIEALLFWKGESMRVGEIAKNMDISPEDAEASLQLLATMLKDHGISLYRVEDVVELRTAAEASPLIEKLTKEDLDKELGKAGIETLTIILYEGPITRRDIDHIRGVNSQFIVRSLLMRGLVERVALPGERGYAYKPTTEALGFLGITKVEDLPEFSTFKVSLDEALQTAQQNNIQNAQQTNADHT